MTWFWIGLGAGAAVYAISLCTMKNTIYRTGPDGNKHWNCRFLFTEGFIGPLRSTKDLIVNGHYKGALSMFFRPSNPWFSIPLGLLGSYYFLRQTPPPMIELQSLKLPNLQARIRRVPFHRGFDRLHHRFAPPEFP